ENPPTPALHDQFAELDAHNSRFSWRLPNCEEPIDAKPRAKFTQWQGLQGAAKSKPPQSSRRQKETRTPRSSTCEFAQRHRSPAPPAFERRLRHARFWRPLATVCGKAAWGIVERRFGH